DPKRNGALRSALTQTGSPDPRNDRICITSSCPRQLVYSRCLQQLRFFVPFAANHDRPSHPCDLVGECNRRHLYRSAIHYSCEPSSFGAMLSRIANDSHSAGDEEPSQIAIALLGYAAEPFLAAGRVLLGHQTNPGGESAPRAERPPIADLGNQSDSDDRTNARDFLEPSALFTRSVPSMDALVDR